MSDAIDRLDGIGAAIYLEVQRDKIVLLHAYVEGHDGLGVVKTLDERRGIVCILTTEDMAADCFSLLESLKVEIPWRLAERPEGLDNIFNYERVSQS